MAIERARLVLPIQDALGNLIPNITVRVYAPFSTVQAGVAFFSSSVGNTELAVPAVFLDGIVDMYTELPMRVRLGVQPDNQPEFYLENREFLISGNNAVFAPAVLKVNNLPIPGRVLTAQSDGTASWAVPTGGGGSGGASVDTDVSTTLYGFTNVHDALASLLMPQVDVAGAGSHDVALTDYYVVASDAGAAFHFPAGAVGLYTIKNNSSGTIYVQAPAGGTIDGDVNPIALQSKEAFTMRASGSTYLIV